MATDLQLTSGDTNDQRFVSLPTYGIFLDGQQVLEGDSFVSYEYQNDSKLSTYPLQAGAFATYNKVATPFDLRVRLTKGGSASARAVYLSEVESAAKSLNLYDVVTPEKTYTSANISKIAHSHMLDRGATMLTVDLWFQEVREIATAGFTTTDPVTGATVTPISKASAPQRNSPLQVGAVQAAPVPQTVQDVVNATLEAQVKADHAAMSHR